MNLGFTFSFGGVLTLTKDYDEVVKFIPIDFIHAETDSPYVVPKDRNGNKLGRRNTSSNVEIIVYKIAEIKNFEVSVVKQKLINNFERWLE
jgi:Tat protein secretion system quality control protein TatD with DNase activity